MTLVNNKTECDSNGGYYRHGYCYYECPETKFLFSDQCYDIRSAQYTQSDCEAVGGHYDDHNYCYLKRYNCTMINNKCYMYRSAHYSNGTCINIGGYYAAEAAYPYTSYCYYASFNCRHHAANRQCYTRSSNQSQAVCETIPHSYFDVSKNTCYYYCTEMPKLRLCFVAHNSSFTRETCKIIRGIYSNRTCYYITPYCPRHKANNGQCYDNRSAVFTCDTCHNIGGHYENGFCYYYQYNCSGYSVDVQCYSTRSSAYSAYSCGNSGRLYRNGNCYYEASKCISAHYKNCTCFQKRTTTKTAVTCAKTGGYYDLHIRQCFYNLSSCPYYNKNSQCYIYRNTNFSSLTCSLIRGYYIYERDESGQHIYACYFDQVNCSNWANNQCYRSFSSSYNEGTCAYIGGYYSHGHNDSGCYYNSFSCSYSEGGQCYDTYYSGWSKKQCDEANGYFYSYYGRCYISYYYCPRVVTSLRKCYFYTSQSYDCSSCRLVDGFLYSGTCYYKHNCSESLFFRSNGQCYENQTKVTTAADCHSMSVVALYDENNKLCYFSSTNCSSEFYINCQCFKYRNTNFSRTTCSLIQGLYSRESDALGRYRYVCYFNEFNCSNWANNQCYRWFSSSFNEGTCASTAGYYSHNNSGCYYNSFSCSRYSTGGQCYDTYYDGWSTSQCDTANGYFDNSYRQCYTSNYYCPRVLTSLRKCYFYTSQSYDCSSCRLVDGFLYSGTCYYKRNCSGSLFLASNGQCYENQTKVTTAADCLSMSVVAYYDEDDMLCYFSSTNCSSEFYVNCQCFKYNNTNFTRTTCSLIQGLYSRESDALGRYRYVCYFNDFNCINWANNQCYRSFSSSYNEGTCASIAGYYSHNNSGCYYNSFSCSRYSTGGQCYDTYYDGWSRSQCDEANGYFYSSWRSRCYISYYYCPRVVTSLRKCYFYTYGSYDCSSCRLVDGFLYSGTCYYKHNCSESLFLRSNGQCYENQTKVTTAADCHSMSVIAFYDENNKLCYFSSTNCSSEFYVNCQCFKYRNTNFSRTTCSLIQGLYSHESDALGRYRYVCYFNEFNCINWANNQCYRSFRSSYNEGTCASIAGYYSYNNSGCYYNSFSCSYSNGGQCYDRYYSGWSKQQCDEANGYFYSYYGRCYISNYYCPRVVTSLRKCYFYTSRSYDCSSCRLVDGFLYSGTCYYKHNCSGSLFLASNGQCYENQTTVTTAADCLSMSVVAFYDEDDMLCYLSSTNCSSEFYVNCQCFKYRNTNFTRTTCSRIQGYYINERDDLGRYSYACYFNQLNCSNWANNHCYLQFSSSYNEGTCASIAGYYSHNNSGCYYDSFSCSGHSIGGQCYDRYYNGWSKSQCDEANGYFYSYRYYRQRCYISNYYCPRFVTSDIKCYFYTSRLYDCNSCRLLHGFLYAGTCYYKSNCSEPLKLASNGQCYENQTEIRTAADCRSMSGEAFFDEVNNLCYFSYGLCSSRHYVNCRCYVHRAEIYNAASCKNFGGYYINGRCYYNSSQCPDRYHSINGQCYRQFSRYSASTCLNIDGYYDFPSVSGASGTCYYNSFNCSGFIVDGSHCYMNRSAMYSRATCTNIGGIYGYQDSGRQYRSAGSYISSGRRYYCLYDTFNCPG